MILPLKSSSGQNSRKKRWQMSNVSHVDKSCAKHGKYKAKVWSLAGKPLVESPCPECHQAVKANDLIAKKSNALWMANQMMRAAGLGSRYDLATFDNYKPFNDDEAKVLAGVKHYTSTFNPGTSKNLFITGNIGRGKTHLASAIVKELFGGNHSVIYTPLANLFTRYNDIINNRNEGSADNFFLRYSNTDLLIIDEFGIMTLTENEKAVLHRIVDARYNQLLPTVIIGNISNLKYEDRVDEQHKEILGMNRFMDKRTLRRLAEEAVVLRMSKELEVAHG